MKALLKYAAILRTLDATEPECHHETGYPKLPDPVREPDPAASRELLAFSTRPGPPPAQHQQRQ
jgi:hypothetical protein